MKEKKVTKVTFVILLLLVVCLINTIGCSIYPTSKLDREMAMTKAMSARALLIAQENREPQNEHCIISGGPNVATGYYGYGGSTSAAIASASSTSTASAASASNVFRGQYTTMPTENLANLVGDIKVWTENGQVYVAISDGLFVRQPNTDEKVYLVGNMTRWQPNPALEAIIARRYWTAGFNATPGDYLVNMVIKKPGQRVIMNDPDPNWAQVQYSSNWVQEQQIQSAIEFSIDASGSVLHPTTAITGLNGIGVAPVPLMNYTSSASTAAAASSSASASSYAQAPSSQITAGDVKVTLEGGKIIISVAENLFERRPNAGEKVYLVGDSTGWQPDPMSEATLQKGYWVARVNSTSGTHLYNMVIKSPGERVEMDDPGGNWAQVQRSNFVSQQSETKSAIAVIVDTSGVKPW